MNNLTDGGVRTKSKDCCYIDTTIVGVLRDDFAIDIRIKNMAFGTGNTQYTVISNTLTKENIVIVCTSQI
jgi:hypothetical protein